MKPVISSTERLGLIILTLGIMLTAAVTALRSCGRPHAAEIAESVAEEADTLVIVNRTDTTSVRDRAPRKRTGRTGTTRPLSRRDPDSEAERL